jgi:hypothetical protein
VAAVCVCVWGGAAHEVGAVRSSTKRRNTAAWPHLSGGAQWASGWGAEAMEDPRVAA